jgi:hypothetical protein
MTLELQVEVGMSLYWSWMSLETADEFGMGEMGRMTLECEFIRMSQWMSTTK